MSDDLPVIDLFAGPGGWSVAAAERGLVEVGIDVDPFACATGREAGHERVMRDVSTLDPETFAQQWFGRRPLHGLIGSPPCDAYANSGLKVGHLARDVVLAHADRIMFGEPADLVCKELDARLGDRTAHLVLEPLRWAYALEPEWVALEQVPFVLPLWEKLSEALSMRGYATATGLLSAEQFGVPQVRPRAFLIASRVLPEVALPAPTHRRWYKGSKRTDNPWHESHLLPWATMATRLNWHETDAVGFPRRDDGRPGGAVLINGQQYRRRDLRAAGLPAFTLTEKVRSWQRWPFGLAGEADGIDTGLPPQRVSLPEASALQGFPMDYPWQGRPSVRFRQVGDAVPPPMAKAVLRAVTGFTS